MSQPSTKEGREVWVRAACAYLSGERRVEDEKGRHLSPAKMGDQALKAFKKRFSEDK